MSPNHPLRPFLACALLASVGALAACGCSIEATPTAPPPPKTDLERRVDSVEAASAVGYDGKALKQDVQGMVKQQDRSQEAFDAANGTANDPAPADP